MHVLIPILSTRHAQVLLQLGAAVARHSDGRGRLLGVVEVPAGRPIATGVTVARRYRRLLQRITALGDAGAFGFGIEVRVAHNVATGVREAVYETGASVIILEWPGVGSRKAMGPVLDDLVSDPPADLLLVRPDPAGNDLFAINSVLVPVRGGKGARLAVNTAEAVARAAGASLSLLHVYRTPMSSAQRDDERAAYFDLANTVHHANTAILEVDSTHPGSAILAEAAVHQVTVIGAQQELARSPLLVSTSLTRHVRQLPGTVVVAKSVASQAPERDRVLNPTITTDRQISQRVDHWFAENTFHAREFRDLGRLVKLKEAQGLTVSLGLPTLNEAATIGRVVRLTRHWLVDRYRLLDELVVIDSGSTDDTARIALEAGATVVQHADILPEVGSHRGKGEALWKGLHHLRGDLVAFCDTDISNFHPRFVFGVLGPLLTDSRIGYVKGFYKRPLKFGGEMITAGGGRVTELCARPVINLFYPELSGLLQPLSGEYAGRRSVLEQLPFFTGYGVEIGLLIDILEGFGLNAIAQVDLGMRVHRNQELFDLSKMAFAIMQVAIKRLGDRHRLHLLEEVNRSMKLIHYEGDRFFLEPKEIGDHERPALAFVPAYLARRHEISSAGNG